MRKLIFIIVSLFMLSFFLVGCNSDDGKIGAGQSGTMSDNSNSTTGSIKEDLGKIPSANDNNTLSNTESENSTDSESINSSFDNATSNAESETFL